MDFIYINCREISTTPEWLESCSCRIYLFLWRFVHRYCIPYQNMKNPAIFTFTDRLNWKTHFLFFLLPAGIHVIINCILFTITAVHCNRIKRDIHRLQTDETSTSTKRKKFIILRAMFVSILYCFSYWYLYNYLCGLAM